jgi:sulfate adenylyltransferase subunit 2
MAQTNDKLSTNERRRIAVELRLSGAKIAEISEKTNLSAPTIIAAHKQFLKGGWAAVDARPRGRQSGKLAASEENLTQLKSAATSAPEDAGIWSLAALSSYCETRLGRHIGSRSVGGYLEQWGLSHTSLYTECKTSGLHNDWLNTHYRRFRESAREQGAVVFWVGRKMVGNLTLMFAHNTRGKYFWLADASSAHIDHACHFINLLRCDCASPVALVVGDQNIFLNKAFRQYVATNAQVRAIADPTFTTTPASTPDVESDDLNTSKRNPQPMTSLTHLQRLEAESIHIMREVVASADKPVMLYSIGKDSAVMLHLAMKAFYPSPPPFALLHVDTGWKFKEMYRFRDETAKRLGLELLVHTNKEGVERGVNPFTHGSALHTDIMKTQALRQALDKHGFDVAFGGARRDEEASRAKERVFSFRTEDHRWDPKNQRPELWNLYNARKAPGESIRVFPISNWTELDVWQYIHQENIPVVPLYFAAKRPVVMRDEQLIMVDDERLPMNPGEAPIMKTVRFRTLGCYPLTAAIESSAASVPEIIRETLSASGSERQGRMIDHDSAGSMERKKQEGYF